MDAISKSQFSNLTGIPRQKCQELVKGLVKKKVLFEGVTQKGNTPIATYGINKDFETWKVLPKKVTITQKGNETITQKGKHKRKRKESVKSYDLTSEPFLLSKKLLDLIIERRNGFKKPDLQKWAKDIDLMMRVDKRDTEEIKAVIEWCQCDDFWQDNILSTGKLRKQFDKLALRWRKNNGRPKDNKRNGSLIWSNDDEEDERGREGCS